MNFSNKEFIYLPGLTAFSILSAEAGNEKGRPNVLIRFANHQEGYAKTAGRPFAKLCNIQNDPFELNNLSKDEDYEEVVDEWKRKL